MDDAVMVETVWMIKYTIYPEYIDLHRKKLLQTTLLF